MVRLGQPQLGSTSCTQSSLARLVRLRSRSLHCWASALTVRRPCGQVQDASGCSQEGGLLVFAPSRGSARVRHISIIGNVFVLSSSQPPLLSDIRTISSCHLQGFLGLRAPSDQCARKHVLTCGQQLVSIESNQGPVQPSSKLQSLKGLAQLGELIPESLCP